MKTKFCLIPFIPAALFMMFLKYTEAGLAENETFMGLHSIQLSYLAVGIGAALFLICVAVNIFDKKTAQFYSLAKNPVCAVFAFLAGILIACEGAFAIMNDVSAGTFSVFPLIGSAFSVLGAIAFIYVASCHFSGKNCQNSAAVLVLLPALWGCVKLLVSFLSYTTRSVLSTDMIGLICYVFITLFFFSNAMVLSNLEGRNPVKGCYIYGLPMIACLLAYSTKLIMENAVATGSFDFKELLLPAGFLSLAVYALAFLIELTLKCRTKDQILAVSESGELGEYQTSTVREEVAFAENYDQDSSYLPQNGVNTEQLIFGADFDENTGYNVMKAVNKQPVVLSTEDENLNVLPNMNETGAAEETETERTPVMFGQEDTADEAEKTENNRIADSDFITSVQKPADEKDEFAVRMDEIDKLILEIQKKQEEDTP